MKHYNLPTCTSIVHVAQWLAVINHLVRIPPESEIFSLSPCDPFPFKGYRAEGIIWGIYTALQLPHLNHYICIG